MKRLDTWLRLGLLMAAMAAPSWAQNTAPAKASSAPAAKAASAPAAKAASAPKTAASKPAEKPKVDLNNATKAQLKTLAGIGDAEADKIIATRPYNSKADMVTKGGIPAGVYQAIRYQIFVGKPKQTKGATDKKQNSNG
jgi:competence protein ComEA